MTIEKVDVVPFFRNKARLLDVAKKTPHNGVRTHVRAHFSRSKLEQILIEARDVSVDALLDFFQLDELKDLCRARDLEDKGRRKADLIERILGRKALVAGENHPGELKTPGAIKEDLSKLVVSASEKFGKNHQGFIESLLAAFGSVGETLEEVELGGTVAYASQGQRSKRKLGMQWEDRGVIMDVLGLDANLENEWNGYLSMCLQFRRVPQYVVLTNLRDVHLYDTTWKRDRARLVFNIAEWPKKSESFAFLSRDWTQGEEVSIKDEDKVSKEVAELVGRLFRSLVAGHCAGETGGNSPKRLEVTRFVLQCITAMFAEDIELLPEGMFTKLLYSASGEERPERKISALFHWMATPMEQRGHPEVPYFNGGLFEDPVVVSLDEDQLYALTRAAEARWSEVDPYIFGSFFESIMNPEVRAATGAHYTSVEDIMKVVGPTVIDPWRERVNYAESLSELETIRKELHEFRVLDPACGSGNFLYVAFRELYRLETELLQRIHKFSKGAQKIAWSEGISTKNFYGIEINRFAVELTKTTLNIAKKLAFDERLRHMDEFSKQLGLGLSDPSLPLDNLDENILSEDALFCDWPVCDAIVGNPPYLGSKKFREVLGLNFVKRLARNFEDVNGNADLVTYWFRRAHDHLPAGGRCGLVATNTIREGYAREASTSYVVSNGGTITDAVSSQKWSGEASVFVSVVNWVKKDHILGPHRLVIAGEAYERDVIHPHLQLHCDLSSACLLSANAKGTQMGVTLGDRGFRFDVADLEQIAGDTQSRQFLRSFTGGTGLMTEIPYEWVLDLGHCETIESAKQAGVAYSMLEKKVKKFVEDKAGQQKRYRGWAKRWWCPQNPRKDFFDWLGDKKRMIAIPASSARGVFVFVDSRIVVNSSCYLFSFDDDYSFGMIQSSIHWAWAQALGSKTKSDTRYDKKIWQKFPWPQDIEEAQVIAVAQAAQKLRATREAMMAEKKCHLRKVYQNADAIGPTHPIHVAQAQLDAAVRAAYYLPEGQDVLAFLLELNQCLAEDEAENLDIQGPGLPTGYVPHDPRWWSEDCIQPPVLDAVHAEQEVERP